jgi:predicted nucleic acid-binding protein
MKKCFYCKEEILEGEGRILPLDVPYVNLWVHRNTCADAADKEYLQKNIERIYEFIEERDNIKKIKRKG